MQTMKVATMSAVTGFTQAIDCHAHVFDSERIPALAGDPYVYSRNELGTVQQYGTVLDAHGFSNAVLVNPYGAYGTDNRHILEGIAGGRGRFRGVAAIAHDITDVELAKLAEGGVVGVRYSLDYPGSPTFAGAEGARTLARVKELGWFVQVVCAGDHLAIVLPLLKKAGVRTLIDHCGRPHPGKGVQHASFQALLEFSRSSDCAVKLSAPFRFSKQLWPYADVEPYVAALVETFTLDRCVWGSDWPFSRTGVRFDYGPIFSCLTRWLPNEEDRRRVLWNTPSKFFGFA